MVHYRWHISIVITFLPGGNITTATVSKDKKFTPRVITNNYPKSNFIYFVNRPREISASSSKYQQLREVFPFYPKRSYQSLLRHFNYHSVVLHCN